MGRFTNASDRPTFSIDAPTDGLGKTPPPKVKEAPKAKEEKREMRREEPDREKQAQEPIRKSEGGRYDGADGYDEISFGGGS